MRLDRRLASLLTLSLAVTAACSKSKSKQGAPAAAATVDTPAAPAPAAGSLSINFTSTLDLAVKSSLVEKGIDPALAEKLSGEVQASGALVVDTSAALTIFHLGDSDADNTQVVAKSHTGPIVAAYLRAAKDDLTPAQTLLLIDTAIHTAAKTAHEAGGLDDSGMQGVLADVTDKMMGSVPEAGLDAATAATAAGATAKAVLEGLVPAGFSAADQAAAAAALAQTIGEKAPSAAADISTVLNTVGQSAASALATLALADPVAGVAGVGGGLMTGFVRSSGTVEARLAAAGELPTGLAKNFAGLIPDDSLGDAVDALTNSSAAALFDGIGTTATGNQLADAAALIAAAPARGLAASAVSSELVVSGNLAGRSLDAMLSGANVSTLDEAARQRFVFKTFEGSVGALGDRDDAAFVDKVAANYMGAALATAAKHASNLGLTPQGAVDEAKVQAFYAGVYTSAFSGMGAISDKNASVGASMLPRFAAQTMAGTVDSLKTVVGTGAVSSGLLTNLPASATMSLGQSLATRLSAADLSNGFANVTGQYVNDVQGLTASRPSIDFNGLTRDVAGAALATFSGSFNARPTDMQEAAGYLNAKLGSFKLDAAVYSAAQNGTSEVVVSAAKNRNGGVLSACAAELPDSLADGDFDAKMQAHPELVVCLKANAACPKARTLPLVVYDWQADSFGTQCTSYRRPNVQNNVACAAGQSYVYGAGCLPDRTTCAGGQSFVFGIGCQSSAYSCPAGQVFVAGNACVAAATSFACASTDRYVAGVGCQASQVQTCVLGQHLQSGQCVPDSAPTCPGGIVYTAATGCALAANVNSACPAGLFRNTQGVCTTASCPVGSFFDTSTSACRIEGSCLNGQVFDAAQKICRLPTAAGSCAATQYLDAVTGQCTATGVCAGGLYWDPSVFSCRANGACAAGFVWNPNDQSCAAANTVQICAACFGSNPAAPTSLQAVPTAGGVGLTWAAVDNAENYIVLRKRSAFSASTPLIDGQPHFAGDVFNDMSVAFVGPFTNFIDNAVDANQTYFYAVGTFNHGAAGPLYSGGVARGSVTTAAATTGAPAIATSFAATSSAGGVQLHWSSVGASGVLILRRAAHDVSGFTPEVNRTYPLAETFGTGTVIFRGPGDSFFDAMTDSSAGITYRYALYPYIVRATGPEYAASPSTAGAAPAAGGAANATDVANFSAFGGPGVIALNWADTQTGRTYIVTRQAGTRPTDAPVDGTSYYAASAIGGSKVVCVTAQLSCQDGAVGVGTTYFYRIFAVVGGTNGPFYSPGIGDFASPTAVTNTAPGVPTGLQVLADVNQIGLTWSGPVAGGYLVVRRTSAATFTPNRSYNTNEVIGSDNIWTTNALSFTDTSAAPGQIYYYNVYSYVTVANAPIYSTASTVSAQRANGSAPAAVTNLSISLANPTVLKWKSSASRFIVLLRHNNVPTITLGSTPPTAPSGGIETTLVVSSSARSADDGLGNFSLNIGNQGLTAGDTYYATVYAVNLNAAIYSYSAPTTVGGEAGSAGVWRVTDGGTASRFNKVVLNTTSNVLLGVGRKFSQTSGDDAIAVAFDPATGAPLWTNPWKLGGSGFDSANDATVVGNDFYVVGTQKPGADPKWFITHLDVTNGTVVGSGEFNGSVTNGDDAALVVAVGSAKVFVGGYASAVVNGTNTVYQNGFIQAFDDQTTTLAPTVGLSRAFTDGATTNDTRVIALKAHSEGYLYALIASGTNANPKTSLLKLSQTNLSTVPFTGNASITFSGADTAKDIELDGNGNVFIVGTHSDATAKYAFIRGYNKGGVPLTGTTWPLTFSVTASGGALEAIGQALTFDNSDLYLGVTAPNPANSAFGRDYVVARYHLDGGYSLDNTWSRRIDFAASNDILRSLVVSNSQLIMGGYVATSAEGMGGFSDIVSTAK